MDAENSIQSGPLQCTLNLSKYLYSFTVITLDKVLENGYINPCADLLVYLQSTLNILLKRLACFSNIEPASASKSCWPFEIVKVGFFYCWSLKDRRRI